MSEENIALSVAVALYNEEESIPPLCKALDATLKPLGKSYEILLVDDVFTTGSTMRACISLLQEKHPKRIHVLVLSKVPKPSRSAKAHIGHADRRA